MTMHDPTTVTRHEGDLQELYKRSIPTWVRGFLIIGIISLFGLYGASFVDNARTYSTKEEMRELRMELKEMRLEIRQDIKELSGKLEPAATRQPGK